MNYANKRSLSRYPSHSPQMRTILINHLMNKFFDVRLGTGYRVGEEAWVGVSVGEEQGSKRPAYKNLHF